MSKGQCRQRFDSLPSSINSTKLDQRRRRTSCENAFHHDDVGGVEDWTSSRSEIRLQRHTNKLACLDETRKKADNSATITGGGNSDSGGFTFFSIVDCPSQKEKDLQDQNDPIQTTLQTQQSTLAHLARSLCCTMFAFLFTNVETRTRQMSMFYATGDDQNTCRLQQPKKFIPILIVIMFVAINLFQIAAFRNLLYFVSLLIARYVTSIVSNLATNKGSIYSPSLRQGKNSSFLQNDASQTELSSLVSLSSPSAVSWLGSSDPPIYTMNLDSSSSCTSSMALVQESGGPASLDNPGPRDYTMTTTKLISPNNALLRTEIPDASTKNPSSNYVARVKSETALANDWGQFADFDGFDEGDCFMNLNVDVTQTCAKDDPYASVAKVIRKRRGDKISVCKLDSLLEEEEGG